MMGDFSIPRCSYNKLSKIIITYSQFFPGDLITISTVGEKSNIPSKEISRNSMFLNEIGLLFVDNTKSKTITDDCKRLGQAYSQNKLNEISTIWSNLICRNSFLTDMLINLTKNSENTKVSKKDFQNYLENSLNITIENNASKIAGFNCLIDILKTSGHIRIIGENEYSIGLNNEPIDFIEPDSENSYKKLIKDNFVHEYTFESGTVARIVIPKDGQLDDIRVFRNLVNTIFEKKYKIVN